MTGSGHSNGISPSHKKQPSLYNRSYSGVTKNAPNRVDQARRENREDLLRHAAIDNMTHHADLNNSPRHENTDDGARHQGIDSDARDQNAHANHDMIDHENTNNSARQEHVDLVHENANNMIADEHRQPMVCESPHPIPDQNNADKMESQSISRDHETDESYRKRMIHDHWKPLEHHTDRFERLHDKFKAKGKPSVACIKWIFSEAKFPIFSKDEYFAPPLFYYMQFHVWFVAPVIGSSDDHRIFVGQYRKQEIWAGVTNNRLSFYASIHKSSKQFRPRPGQRLEFEWSHALKEVFGFHLMPTRITPDPIVANSRPRDDEIEHDNGWWATQNLYLRAVIHILRRFKGLHMQVLDVTTAKFGQVHPDHFKLPFIDEWKAYCDAEDSPSATTPKCYEALRGANGISSHSSMTAVADEAPHAIEGEKEQDESNNFAWVTRVKSSDHSGGEHSDDLSFPTTDASFGSDIEMIDA